MCNVFTISKYNDDSITNTILFKYKYKYTNIIVPVQYTMLQYNTMI